MNAALFSNDRYNDLDPWHKANAAALLSGVGAIQQMLPLHKRNGIQIRSIENPFSTAFDIPVCENPLPSSHRGKGPVGENTRIELPYSDVHLDFILMCYCDGFISDQQVLFNEAYRILRDDGALVIAFIDSNSSAGRLYLMPAARRNRRRERVINCEEKIVFELSHAGFRHFEFVQTLFNPPEEIKEIQIAKPGYGQGSLVVVRAIKTFNPNTLAEC